MNLSYPCYEFLALSLLVFIALMENDVETNKEESQQIDNSETSVLADPSKLYEYWMEWEEGKTPPGRVISNLKKGGMHNLLEKLVEAASSQNES